jgi:hypothetical protein
MDGYQHCCGCCPDWWDEVEGTLKHTLHFIKQVVSAAFKGTSPADGTDTSRLIQERRYLDEAFKIELQR